MTMIYEQRVNGRVAERLIANHTSGMATIEKLDGAGHIAATEICGIGDGRVAQFIYFAEPLIPAVRRSGRKT